MNIYFILAEDVALVKIGRSINPERRLQDMVPHCPIELALLGSIEGPCLLEKQLHTLLFEHHHRNEWFRWNEAVKTHVDALLDGSFDLATLPECASKAWVLERRAMAALSEMERGQAA